MAKAKSGRKAGFFNSFWLSLAAASGWAALNVPPAMDAGSAGAWALAALAVGLLVRAGLALLSPLLALAGEAVPRLLQTRHAEDES